MSEARPAKPEINGRLRRRLTAGATALALTAAGLLPSRAAGNTTHSDAVGGGDVASEADTGAEVATATIVQAGDNTATVDVTSDRVFVADRVARDDIAAPTPIETAEAVSDFGDEQPFAVAVGENVAPEVAAQMPGDKKPEAAVNGDKPNITDSVKVTKDPNGTELIPQVVVTKDGHRFYSATNVTKDVLDKSVRDSGAHKPADGLGGPAIPPVPRIDVGGPAVPPHVEAPAP